MTGRHLLWRVVRFDNIFNHRGLKSLANWLPYAFPFHKRWFLRPPVSQRHSAANRLPVWRFVNCLWRFAAVWVYWTTLISLLLEESRVSLFFCFCFVLPISIDVTNTFRLFCWSAVVSYVFYFEIWRAADQNWFTSACSPFNRCARLDITEVTLITASSKKTEPHPSPWGGWVPDLVDTQLINNFSSR